MATYEPDEDITLWSGRLVPFKPQASMHVEVKQYRGGEPKVVVIEAGVGFRGKPYTGALLKRTTIDDLDKMITLLTEAKGPLQDARDEWEKTRPKEEEKP